MEPKRKLYFIFLNNYLSLENYLTFLFYTGSSASEQGLQPGDKILKVNDMDMKGVTREEAVLLLLSLQDEINLTAQYCKTEYELVIQHQKGDSFFIK